MTMYIFIDLLIESYLTFINRTIISCEEIVGISQALFDPEYHPPSVFIRYSPWNLLRFVIETERRENNGNPPDNSRVQKSS